MNSPIESLGFTTTQHRAIGINYAFIGLTVILMIIRLYARLVISKATGSDDFLMFLGALTTLGLSVTTIVAVQHGVGRRRNASDTTRILQAHASSNLDNAILYSVAIGFVKHALLSLYIRLDDRRTMRWTVYILAFFVTVVSVAGVIVSVIGCSPPEVFWKDFENAEALSAKCIDQKKLQSFWDACGALVVITDVTIWAVPIPMVWRLNLPKKKKYALSGIFLLGTLSVAAGCVRFYYVRLLANEPEQFFYLADSLNWCAVEIYVAIFCGSTSSFRTFVKHFFPSFLGSAGRSNASKSKGSSHPCDFRMERLGHNGKSTTLISSKKRGSIKLNLSANNSQEAIVSRGRILLKTEVTQDAQRFEAHGTAFRFTEHDHQ